MAVYPTSVVTWAKISGTWTNISAVVAGDLTVEMGMHSGDYNNRLASPGRLTFDINNASGTYTPSSTFGKGVEIKVEVTYAGVTKTKFYGRIEELDPDVGTWGNQHVRVTVMDWLQFATDQVVRERPVEINKRAGDAVATLLDSAHIKPLNTLLDSGTQIFPTVFDSISKNTKIYQELDNLVISEWGYAYMDQGGERFHFEGYDARANTDVLTKLPVTNLTDDLLKADGFHLLKADGGKLLLNRTSDAAYINTFDSLDVIHGRHLLNDVTFTINPRVVDTSLVVLFNLGAPIFVPELGVVEFTGYFSDPNGGSRITATNLQDPVVTTDYLMFANEDGTGTNLSLNLTINPRESSEGTTYQVINAGAAGWITFFQHRGFGIYKYNPVDVPAEDTNSQKEFGPKSLTIRQTYQQSGSVANTEANKILEIEREPRTVVLRAYFTANDSDVKMKSFMYIDIGNLTGIECTKPPVDSKFYVNGLRWKITPGGIITYSWVLKEVIVLRPIAVRFSGVHPSRNVIDFGTPSRLTNIEQKTLTAWVYLTTNSNTPVMAKYGGTDPTGWYWFVMGTGKMQFRHNFDPGDGLWTTTNDVMTAILNGWHHIAVTFDASNAANDPIFYVDGAAVAVTENSTPSGVSQDDTSATFLLGNMKIVTDVLGYTFFGLMKDTRIYNRILSATEIATLAAGENDYTTVPDGRVFNGLFVLSSRYFDYIDDPITPDMKVLDKLFESPGTVAYDTSLTTYQVKGADPDLTTYP